MTVHAQATQVGAPVVHVFRMDTRFSGMVNLAVSDLTKYGEAIPGLIPLASVISNHGPLDTRIIHQVTAGQEVMVDGRLFRVEDARRMEYPTLVPLS